MTFSIDLTTIPGVKITLTPHLKQYVAEKVKDGRYGNSSDVVRDALRQMERREHSGASPELRRLLRAGLRSPLRRWTEAEMSRRLEKALTKTPRPKAA